MSYVNSSLCVCVCVWVRGCASNFGLLMPSDLERKKSNILYDSSSHYAWKIWFLWLLGDTWRHLSQPCRQLMMPLPLQNALLSKYWRKCLLYSWSRRACGLIFAFHQRSSAQSYQKAHYMGNLCSVNSKDVLWARLLFFYCELHASDATILVSFPSRFKILRNKNLPRRQSLEYAWF